MLNKVWYLQQIDLFQGISDEEIMQIADQVIEKKCAKKEMLYTPFDEQDSIWVLKKGEVTLYHSHYGKKLIIDTLKPGSIFGNINFEEGSADHFAEVTEDAYMCIFSKEDFMKVIQAKPDLMIKLIKLMSGRLSEYEKRIKNGLYDAKEKIIHHLEIESDRNSNGLFAKLKKKNFTHEKIAEHIGLSRETVTRAINDLKKEGKIKADEKGVIFITYNNKDHR